MRKKGELKMKKHWIQFRCKARKIVDEEKELMLCKLRSKLWEFSSEAERWGWNVDRHISNAQIKKREKK